MWNCFKKLLLKGTKLFISKVSNFTTFRNENWEIPIDKDLRNCIKEKNRLWKKFILTKDREIQEHYKKIRNFIRNQTREIYKKEQYQIAKECKSNPEIF